MPSIVLRPDLPPMSEHTLHHSPQPFGHPEPGTSSSAHVLNLVMRFLVLLVLSLPNAFAASPPLHYQIDTRLDPSERSLQAQASVLLNDGLAFELLLNPGLQLEQAELDGVALKTTRKRGQATRIAVPAGQIGRTLTLRWHGTLSATPTHLRHDETLGWRAPSAAPQGSFLPASSLWYPLPLRDRDIVPHNHQLHITTPEGQLGMSAGLPGERLQRDGEVSISYHFPYPGRGMDLIAGPYQLAERDMISVDGRRLVLRTLFHDSLTRLADSYLDSVAQHLARFERTIGPYPYDSFSVVSSPTPTGFGMASFTYLGEQVLHLPFIRDTSLAHEVLHNWWGNGVFPDYATGNWSEGLTTFMADYGHAERRGDDAARAMRLGWLRELSGIPPEADTALSEFTARHHGVSQAVGYNKAAMLFLMLRDRLGEDVFYAGLRQFWQQHQFQTASWHDLRRAFETSAGHPLDDWFTPWLQGRGLPMLSLEPGEHDSVIIRQHGQPWPLEATLHIEHAQGSDTLCLRLGETTATDLSAGNAQCVTATTSGDAASVSVDLSAWPRPFSVTLDPDSRLLRSLGRFEAPPILRELQFAQSVQLITIGPRDMRQNAEALAQRLLDNRPEPLAARRHPNPELPMLVIGLQDDIEQWLAQRALPDTPTEVIKQGDARMWTHRLPSGTPLAVIAADTPAALSQALRPLPHYRQQSWLVLENGRALSRGTWPAQAPRVWFR